MKFVIQYVVGEVLIARSIIKTLNDKKPVISLEFQNISDEGNNEFMYEWIVYVNGVKYNSIHLHRIGKPAEDPVVDIKISVKEDDMPPLDFMSMRNRDIN